MKVLLIGASGQLGQDILRLWTKHEIVPVTHEALDICDAARVEAMVEETRPECVINTAAFHLVDLCEDQAHRAFEVNVGGVCNVARSAEKAGAVLVQFSTDYVFDGKKASPYVESDRAEPLSTYAMSRLAGEWIARHYCSRYFVVRTCGLYGLAGSKSKTGNFVETMLKLAHAGKPIRVVGDQIVTPTSTADLAAKLGELVTRAPFGLYHMTNTGQCSWYEFAAEIFRLFDLKADLSQTTTAAFGAKARRPPYSVLDNKAMRAAGIPEFRRWQEALADYGRARQSAAVSQAIP
ncbi:MAG: dTDP-4-dehydrorhamnose reductase [Terriglobales bacterium]